jgi:hypothetical protein
MAVNGVIIILAALLSARQISSGRSIVQPETA